MLKHYQKKILENKRNLKEVIKSLTPDIFCARNSCQKKISSVEQRDSIMEFGKFLCIDCMALGRRQGLGYAIPPARKYRDSFDASHNLKDLEINYGSVQIDLLTDYDKELIKLYYLARKAEITKQTVYA